MEEIEKGISKDIPNGFLIDESPNSPHSRNNIKGQFQFGVFEIIPLFTSFKTNLDLSIVIIILGMLFNIMYFKTFITIQSR